MGPRGGSGPGFPSSCTDGAPWPSMAAPSLLPPGLLLWGSLASSLIRMPDVGHSALWI